MGTNKLWENIEKKYNLGEQIEKEVRKKYRTIDDFATAYGCSRSTVYGFFNSTQIDLDKLMKISSLLDRDFFKEFSALRKEAGFEIAKEEEDAEEVKERIGQLMPKDHLHVIEPSKVKDIADEFFETPRKRPLLMFYVYGQTPTDAEFFKAGEKVLGIDQIMKIYIKKGELELEKSKIEEYANKPYRAIEILAPDYNYDTIIPFAEKLIEASEPQKHVFIIYKINNRLDTGYNEKSRKCIKYYNDAERCYNVWHRRAHIFVADNENGEFVTNKSVYGSYLLSKSIKERGLMFSFTCLEDNSKVNFNQLMNELPEQHTFDIENEYVDGKTARCIFTEKKITPYYRELFKEDESHVPLYKKLIFEYSRVDGNIIGIDKEEYK